MGTRATAVMEGAVGMPAAVDQVPAGPGGEEHPIALAKAHALEVLHSAAAHVEELLDVAIPALDPNTEQDEAITGARSTLQTMLNHARAEIGNLER